MADELETVGENSLDRWGTYVLLEFSKTIIPVHGDPWSGMNLPIFGRCRCRIVAGQWVHEPDACPTCKDLAEQWNSEVRMPAGYEE